MRKRREEWPGDLESAVELVSGLAEHRVGTRRHVLTRQLRVQA